MIVPVVNVTSMLVDFKEQCFSTEILQIDIQTSSIPKAFCENTPNSSPSLLSHAEPESRQVTFANITLNKDVKEYKNQGRQLKPRALRHGTI